MTKSMSILDDILGPAGPLPAAPAAGLPVYQVNLDRLVDNAYQPRQRNDPDHVLRIARSLLELASSLPETRGLQQVPIARIMRWADSSPIPAAAYDDPAELRRLIADSQYVVEMAFGHSRRLAFDMLAHGPASVFPEQYAGVEQAANLDDHDPAAYAAMPIILLPLDDRTMWQQAVTENAARQDITAIEEAMTLRRATSELRMSIEEAGRTLGKSRSAASNLLRLLELPQQYQDAILSGILSETHGRTLLALKPAMHLLTGTPADLGGMTRRELEEYVAALIASRQPLAPAANTGYRTTRYGYSRDNISTVQFSPPAWPYDWLPPVDPAIVGACAGCQWRVNFSADPGPRCARVMTTAGARSCYDAKTNAWQAQQMKLQRAAIQHAAPPPAPAPAAAEAEATPGEPDAPAVTVSQETGAGSVRVASVPVAEDTASVTWFSRKGAWALAPATLIKKDLCGPKQCKCFVLAYNTVAGDDSVRPDPNDAPNMCYGCTSAQRLARRKQELEHGDLTAKRAAIREENRACELMLRGALYRLTAADIWHSTPFMRDLMRTGSLTSGLGHQADRVGSMDALVIQDHIWMKVAQENCAEWSQFSVDGENRHWKMEKVDAWLRKIAAGFTREIGGVWAELREDKPAESSIMDMEVDL